MYAEKYIDKNTLFFTFFFFSKMLNFMAKPSQQLHEIQGQSNNTNETLM